MANNFVMVVEQSDQPEYLRLTAYHSPLVWEHYYPESREEEKFYIKRLEREGTYYAGIPK